MQVRLEVAHTKANVKRVVLRHDAVIGRSAECSLRIASSLVSRQHCQITLKDGAVYVRDLRSSNGTFLNGTPLKPQEDVLIPPGSELSVGGVRFYVRYDSTQPLPGPGSTVDLPGAKEPTDSGTTAEWQVSDVVAARAGAVADEAAAETAEESLAETAPDVESDEPEVEPPPAKPAPLPKPMRVAMPFEVPSDPMATPSVVPANVPAAAPDEEVFASRGDEIDTLMIESEGPSETETIDAGSFRFEDAESESFGASSEGAEAADEQADDSATDPDDKKGKKGLRSLFSLFGRKKMPQLEETVSASDAGAAAVAPQAAFDNAPIQDDTVSEDATSDFPPGSADIPEALPLADDEEEPIALLEAAAEETEFVDPALLDVGHSDSEHSGQPAEPGFADFLKQIGQQ